METIFAVLVDWVNECESDADVHLFDTWDKAAAHLKEVSLDELRNRLNDIIYYEKDERTLPIIEGLMAELGNPFEIADNLEEANYVLEVTPCCFTCFLQGEYSRDHMNARILEKKVE